MAIYLRDAGEVGAPVKDVLHYTRVKKTTAYKILEELKAEGKVSKLGEIWYSKETLVNLGEYGFSFLHHHGIVIKAPDWPVAEIDPQGPPRSVTDPVPFPVGDFGAWHRRPPQNPDGETFFEAYAEYLRRRVRFRWWPTTRMMLVYLKTTKNPLSFEEFLGLKGFFVAKCHPVDPARYFYLVEHSMNVDYRTLRMEGLECVRWQPALDLVLSAYNKKGMGLRIEAEARLQRGPETIPWPRVFDGLMTLDPRVQEARAEEAKAKALEAYAKEVGDLRGLVAGLQDQLVVQGHAIRELVLTLKKGAEGYKPPSDDRAGVG